MRRAFWAVVLAALVVGAWWAWRPGGTVASVAGWLESGDCSSGSVSVQSIRLPVPASGLRRFAEQERFADAAREVEYVRCEHLGGSIFYFRFANVAARLHATAADAGWYRRSTSCAKGTEVLYDNLVDEGVTAQYCRRLHFHIEPPQKD